MDQESSSALQHRLLSCLETILELESDLKDIEHGHALFSEFSQLKSFVERIDQVMLNEYDVLRIEKATANFLEEFKGPLGILNSEPRRKRIMQ